MTSARGRRDTLAVGQRSEGGRPLTALTPGAETRYALEMTLRRGVAWLCLAVALSAGAVSAAGVFLRGSGAAVEVVSPRGERYPMATDGVYAWNAQRVVAEGVGWDVFTLAVVVPALLLTAPVVARGSFRGRLLALGLLAYLFYQYLMYAVTWAFGPLLLPFVVVYGASLLAMVAVASSLARDGVAGRFDDRYPRRGMAVLCFILAAALVAMWLARIATGLRGDLAGAMLLGQTTMVVQALDLGLVVPLAVLTGVLCWRRHPVGLVLGSVVAVKAIAMALAICAMVVSAWKVEGRLEVAPLAFFGAAALAAAWLGARMYRSVRPALEPG